MEKEQFTITRKRQASWPNYYYTVSSGVDKNPHGSKETRIFNTRIQAIGFINEELQKDQGKFIGAVWYPSHVIELRNKKTDYRAPAIRIGPDHFLNKVGVRWVRFNSVNEVDGMLVYFHRKYWEEV